MNNKNSLDLLDRKILFELTKNARQTDTQIGKCVRANRDTVRYRILRLQEQGKIQYFMTLINSIRLGYDWYRTFFKFHGLTLEKEKQIIDWFSQRVSWIVKVQGPWDFNTALLCKTPYDYQNIIREFLQQFGKYVEKYEPAIIIRMWHYTRKYLLPHTRQEKDFPIIGFHPGEKTTIVSIDKVDEKILRFLAKNARAQTTDIARQLKLTETIVRYRMRKLESKNIIIGYRAFLDMSELGYRYFKVHFTFDNFSEKEKIFSYIHNHKNTVHTTELVSGADLETEFQVRSNEELYDDIEDIRRHFPKTIRAYTFMQYTKEYKFSYLPEAKTSVLSPK